MARPAPAASAALPPAAASAATSTRSARFAPDWRGVWLAVLPPVLGMALLVGIWAAATMGANASLPTPAVTFDAAVKLFSDPFYDNGPNDQGIGWNVLFSLQRVAVGFGLAAAVSIPLGFIIGRFDFIGRMFGPLISLLKPVSPLAWLPIVTMVVSALYVTTEGAWFEKSFITSAITVMLCSLWPTLINTAVGVSSVDKDLINVGKVLRLSKRTQISKIIIPSSLPLIFTGMRLSLGVGWMVLIAAEMLAQNPGLGKFVWDEFQNGSSHSLGRIMVAVFTIGVIGFLLDRVMATLQQLFTFGEN